MKIQKSLLALMFSLFCLGVIYFLIPVFFHFGPSLLNFRDTVLRSGDAYQTILESFAIFHVFDPRSFLGPSQIFFYPDRFFYFYEGSLTTAIFYNIFYGLTHDYVFSYNILVPFLLACAGLTAYILVLQTTKNRAIALISGYIYVYNPAALQLYWNVRLLAAWGLYPLLYLGIFWIRTGHVRRGAILLGLTLFVLGCTSLQMWIFALIALVLFFSLSCIFERRHRPWLTILLSVGLSSVPLIPLIWYHHYFSILYGIHRSVNSLIINSSAIQPANIAEFFLPTCQSFFAGLFHRSLSCWSGELGWIGITIPVVLLICGARYMRTHVSDGSRRFIYLCLAEIFTLYLFALGPVATFGEKEIWMPYGALYATVPGISGLRVPPRILFIAYPMIIVGVAYALLYIWEKNRIHIAFFLLACFVVLYTAEAAFPFSGGYFSPSALSEPVWKKLAHLPPGVMINYPIDWFGGQRQPNRPDETEGHFAYLAHRHPTISGYPGVMSYSSARLLESLLSADWSKKDVVNVLTALDVSYLVIDTLHTKPVVMERMLPMVIYRDERYAIVHLDGKLSQRVASFLPRPESCVIEADMATRTNEHVSVLVRFSNTGSLSIVQKAPQQRVGYTINTPSKKLTGSTWLQLPFVVFANSTEFARAEFQFSYTDLRDFGDRLFLSVSSHDGTVVLPCFR